MRKRLWAILKGVKYMNNLKSEKTELKTIIYAYHVQYKNMKIHDEYLYYLKTENPISNNKELLQHRI